MNYYSPKQAAEILSVNVSTITKKLICGEIPHVIIGGSDTKKTRRIAEEDLTQWLCAKNAQSK